MLETENNEREGRFLFLKKMAEIDETTWRLSGIKKNLCGKQNKNSIV